VEHIVEFFTGGLWLLWLAIMGFLFFGLPVAKILKRTGHSPLWCLAFFIPIVAYIGLWIFAFKRWPIDRKSGVDEVFSL